MNLYSMNIQCLKDLKTFESQYEKASVLRKRKIDAFRMEKEKLRCLAADVIFRQGVSDYENERKKERQDQLQQFFGTYGKPYLKTFPELFFNISHSGDFVVAAFGEEEIGIDIQLIKSFKDTMAERFFTLEEQHYIKRNTEKQEQNMEKQGILMWACKESYLKYTGEGLHRALNSFSVDLESQCVLDVNTKETLAYLKVLNQEELGISHEYLCVLCKKSPFALDDFRIYQIN